MSDPSQSDANSDPDLGLLNEVVLMMYPLCITQTIILLESVRSIPAEFRMYRRAWKRGRLNAAETLFVAIKYLTILSLCCDAVVENSSWLSTARQCNVLHNVYYYLLFFAVHLVAVAISWRCYIIFHRSRRVLYGLLVALAFHLALTFIAAKHQHKSDVIIDGFCQMMGYRQKDVWHLSATHYLMFNIAFDASVMGLASRRLLQNARGPNTIMGISRLLLVHNVHYVLIVCTANLVEWIYLVASNGSARNLLSVSCVLQIITGLNMLIEEQDMVHNQNAVHSGHHVLPNTRSGSTYVGKGGSGGGGAGGVHIQQSTFASSATQVSTLPTLKKSFDLTTFGRHGRPSDSSSDPRTTSHDDIDMERQQGQTPGSSQTCVPLQVPGWITTPLFTHTPTSSDAMVLPSPDVVETVKVAYPTRSNSQRTPNAADMALEDVHMQIHRASSFNHRALDGAQRVTRPVHHPTHPAAATTTTSITTRTSHDGIPLVPFQSVRRKSVPLYNSVEAELSLSNRDRALPSTPVTASSESHRSPPPTYSAQRSHPPQTPSSVTRTRLSDIYSVPSGEHQEHSSTSSDTFGHEGGTRRELNSRSSTEPVRPVPLGLALPALAAEQGRTAAQHARQRGATVPAPSSNQSSSYEPMY